MPELAAPEAPAASPEPRDQMPAMSFLQHLEELRRRIVWSLVGVGVGFGVAWWKVEKIYDLMQAPIVKVLAAHKLDQQLVYTHPVEAFNVYLKIALIAGLFLASPWVLYHVWAFIAPGLYRHEKRYVVPFLFSTVLLFVTGGFFGYVIVFPAAMDFLIGFSSQFRPMITVSEYTNLFLTLIVGMGLIFEMPILIFFLSLMGVISAGWMWRNFRYAILGIFIVAAIVTPTTDILNMCLFAAPMVGLYALSIGIAWLVHPSRRRKRAEKRAAKDAAAAGKAQE
ncbi:MAG TPA: twin-arginine translocase subunit TatC [Terriglobales bacterium]|nr:twin-arginine translocase subunit TatC [Terriglobales bacterium]